MFKTIDWIYLRRPAIIFLILVISSVVFYFGGLQFKNSENERFTKVKNALSSSHSALNKKSKEIALVDDYLDAYKALNDNGFIGDERRLSWVESIKETNKEIKLPSFNYTILAQKDFSRKGLKQNKRVKAMAYQIKIDLGVLHEEDIFKVFKLLDENVQSHFVVDACEVSIGQNKELKIDKANLKAHCIVNWVHLMVAEK